MEIEEIQNRSAKATHRIKVRDPEDVDEGDTLRIGAVEETYHKYPESHPSRSDGGQTRMVTGFVDEGGIPIIVDGLGDSWTDDSDTCCYIYFRFDVDNIDPVEVEESGVLEDMTRQSAVRIGRALRKELG
jgi:hypothetical protein